MYDFQQPIWRKWGSQRIEISKNLKKTFCGRTSMELSSNFHKHSVLEWLWNLNSSLHAKLKLSSLKKKWETSAQCALCSVCVHCAHPFCQKIVYMNDYKIRIHTCLRMFTNLNSIQHTKNQLSTLENKKVWKTVKNVRCAVLNVHCAVVLDHIWPGHSKGLEKICLC